MTTTDDWGVQIRAARARAGWSQQHLADQTGVAQPTISRIEAGREWPHRSTVDRLLAALDSAGPDPSRQLTLRRGCDENSDAELSEVDLAAELRPYQWLIDGIAARGCVTMLAGRYGSGKSLLAQSWAATAAAGGGTLAAWTIHAGRVLIVDAENPPGLIISRLRSLGLPKDAEANISVRRANAFDLEANAGLLDRVLDHTKPDLLVLDTWTSMWNGSEMSIPDVKRCLNGLRQTATDRDLAILLLHHMTKGGISYRGGTAVGATIEAVFLMWRDLAAEDDEKVRYLHCDKMRIAPEPRDVRFRIGFPPQAAPIDAAELAAARERLEDLEEELMLHGDGDG